MALPAIAIVPGAPAVATAPSLEVKNAVLTLASRSAMVEKYRYDPSIRGTTIVTDLNLLKTEWSNRLKRSITEEADRTGNWSLLWKAEAIYESMDSRIDQLLLQILRDDPRNFETRISVICNGGRIRETVQNEAANLAQGSPLLQEQFDRFWDPNSGECVAFQRDMNVITSRFRDARGNPIDPAPSLGDWKAAAPARAGGVVLPLDLAKLVQWWILRRQAKEASDAMFAQLSSWIKCDGKMKIPEKRPPLEGFNHLSAKIVEWLIWPFMSPGVFPPQRQVMVYGPAGSGKTVIAQLAAFDIAKALMWADVKRISLPADREEAWKLANPNDYMTFYFVDVLKLRSSDPEVVGARLRNYLSCLQYEVTRDKSRAKRRKMGLMVLDNLDALFVTDDELRRQPRAERKASQLKSWVYKASPEVVAKFGGRPTTKPAETPTKSTAPSGAAASDSTTAAGPREGGQGSTTTTTTTTTVTASGRSMADVLSAILSPAALEADFPDVRLIWSARYPWKLPIGIHALVRRRQLFVDLPGSKARRSYLEDLLRDDLYTNIADRIVEETKLDAMLLGARGDAVTQLRALSEDTDRKPSTPDQVFYDKEKALRAAIKTTFLTAYNTWQRFPIKPTPGNLMSSLIHGEGAPPQFKFLADAYVAQCSDTLNAIVTASGMSLEGYCKLQSEYGLSVTEVDSYLVTTGKKRDGYAGNTPYGYTLEDLQNFYRFLKATVNQRLLKEAFELKQAFIYGSTRFASTGCQNTAAEIERKRGSDEPGLITDLVQWTPSESEQTTCKVALGPDLTDLKTGVPVLPLWARYGSHRILKMDDAIKALNAFERFVTPKPDYPEFVNYAMYGTPRLNRPLLGPGHVSQICRARPGLASTFLFPPNGILTPAANSQSLGQLAPWAVLFTPPPRFGGHNAPNALNATHGAATATAPLTDQSFRGQYNRLLQQRSGGAAAAAASTFSSAALTGGAQKKRRQKRNTSSGLGSLNRQMANARIDDDYLPIDAVFQRQ